MSGKRKRLSPNALVRGADYNTLLDMLEANQNIRVGPGLQMQRTSAGTFISQLNRGEPQFQGRRADEPVSGTGGNVVTFPAVVLDSLGWQDNSTDPNAQPPANKYVWRYLLHMCYWTDEGERTMIPSDASYAPTGSANLYPMPWDGSGGGWSFLRDHDYYMAGGMMRNGITVRSRGWNLVEQYNNGLAGYAQGNGVDIKTLQETNQGLDIQPVPIGTIVIVHAMAWTYGHGWFFTYENGIDGSCG